MKKRDGPLDGDSPARLRVPVAGTVSLGGVVAVCRWLVRHSRNQVRGRLRRASGHRSRPRPESGRRPVRRVWGWGKRDGSPQGERAGEAATPVRGAAWWNGAPVQAGAGRRRPGIQAGHLSAPFALRVVSCCLRYDSARPLSGQGRGQAFAKGLSPRRLRRETSLPGRQRIPRTAVTSSVPPSPVGTRAAALHWVGTAPPVAGLLRLVCAIPPTEPDVPLSRHPALH